MADESESLNQDDTESLSEGGSAASSPDGVSPSPEATAAPDTPGESAEGSTESVDALAQEDIEHLFNQAEQALASVTQNEASSSGTSPFELRDFGPAAASTEAATIDLLRDVELNVSIELGRTHMYLEEVLKLRKGSVVPLDSLAGDPVDVYVNGRLVARGEILVLNDNFCIRVAELLASEATPA